MQYLFQAFHYSCKSSESRVRESLRPGEHEQMAGGAASFERETYLTFNMLFARSPTGQSTRVDQGAIDLSIRARLPHSAWTVVLRFVDLVFSELELR